MSLRQLISATPLWRIQDDPVVWTEPPAPREGVEGALHYTTPPHGAMEFVAIPTRRFAALLDAVECAQALVALLDSPWDSVPDMEAAQVHATYTLRTALTRIGSAS